MTYDELKEQGIYTIQISPIITGFYYIAWNFVDEVWMFKPLKTGTAIEGYSTFTKLPKTHFASLTYTPIYLGWLSNNVIV